ncbi:MFS transporter [Myxococcota bacterium]|nr:MFS transporter [Myxococcota bacterium]
MHANPAPLSVATLSVAPLSVAPLSVATLLAYSMPMVAVNFSLVLFMSYVNNYAVDVLLVPPVAMGAIFGAGRLWDAITDPITGVWSDRTQHAWGRRRPWIAASALPIAVSGWMIWAPPDSLSSTALIVWMTVAVFAFNLAMTIFYTPHQALGAELTLDHHAVSRIFAWRQAAGYIGMVGCLVFGMPHLMTAEDPKAAATTFAIACGIAVVVSIAVSTAYLREPAGNRRRGGSSNLGVARDVWRNRHSRMLLTMIFIEHTGSGASMVVAPFLMKYVIGLPGSIGAIFMFYVGSSLISLPLWVALSKRIGKKETWLVGLAVGITGYACLFFVGHGDLAWMQMVVSMTGACSACGTVLGQSLLADVIDADELETGERKEGAYYSAFTFLYKTSSGIMAMITGFTLSAVGFVPNLPAQSETAQLAIRSLNALAPLVSMVIGAFILARFSLDAAKHAEIRRALDARRAAAAS